MYIGKGFLKVSASLCDSVQIDHKFDLRLFQKRVISIHISDEEIWPTYGAPAEWNKIREESRETG